MNLDARTVVVFSHPNHELSIFGTLLRLKPKMIFLTDGGGPHRVAETAEGLKRLGLYTNSVFLNYTEESFYGNLVRKSSSFFRSVTEEVRTIMRLTKPDQVLCDAVEFYNPVHDLSLSITASAVGDISKVVEVPLVYQAAGKKDDYRVQSFPESRTYVEVPLTEAEGTEKRKALHEVYTILMKTMGPLLAASPHTLQREVFSAARDPRRAPDENYFLRYDERAKILKNAGKIEDTILYEDHFLPVVSEIF